MLDQNWVLPTIVALPLLGSPLVLLLGHGRLGQGWLAPAILEVSLLLGLWLVGLVSGGRTIAVSLASTAVVGQQFSLRLAADELTGLFIVVVSVAGLAIAVFRAGEAERGGGGRPGQAMLLLSVGVVSGVLASGNLFTLYAFWQMAVVLLTLAGLVGTDGRALGVAWRYFLTAELTALLLLFALGLAYAGGETDALQGWLGSDAARRPAVTALLLAAGLIAVAAAPFRRRSAAADAVAKLAVAPFLFGMQTEVGLYILARTVAAATPEGTPEQVANVLAVVGALMVVLAGAAALAQREAGALVAFLALAQTGLTLLGFGTGERIGLAGALFLVVGQTLALVLVLLALELVRRRAGGGRLDVVGGLARELPLAATAYTVGALSLVGVPPWSGFIGQLLVYHGLASRGAGGWLIAVAACIVGSVLASAALVRFGGRLFLGERSLPGPLRASDLFSQTSVVVVLAAVVAVALLPRLVLDHFVSATAGVAFAGSWADLAVAPAPGYQPVRVWSPLLGMMLIVLPLSILALSRAPLRRPAAAVSAGQTAAVATLAKELSPGDAVPLPAEASTLLLIRWWRAAQKWDGIGNLDPILLAHRLLLPVARLAATCLRFGLRLLLP